MNCGVTSHDDECLCDVVIPHPTGWVDCAVQDMWMGQEIVTLMGYTVEWEPVDIVAYLRALTYAKDNWARAEYENTVRVGTTAPAILRDKIRGRLQSMDNPSIFQVADELGLDHDSLMFVLFTNRRHMSREELEGFERDVLERKFTSPHGLGVAYNMPYKSASKLHSYWGTPFRPRESTVSA